MFGLGWSEMVLVGIVALIVIGPKDLPNLFRTMGEFTGKARRMAREFSRAMEQAADESGMKDVQKTLQAAANPKKFGVDKIREATSFKDGSATQKLSQERQEAKDKILAHSAKVADERIAREKAEAAAAAAAAEAEFEPEPDAPTVKTGDSA